MSEHHIRLRGGWEWHDRSGDAAPRRVSLPLDHWPEPGVPVRITRRFQRPPIDPLRESLWLRLDAVPGLVSVSLNGRLLGPAPTSGAPILLPIGDALGPGNLLELDVLCSGPAGLPEASCWGEVALVIRSEDAPRPGDS